MKRKTFAVFSMCDKKDPADVFSQVCEQLLVFVSLFNESVVLFM